MRALAADLGRGYDNWEDDGGGILCAPPTAEPRLKRAPTFREAGLSFIELRPAHLDFMRVIYGRCVPPFEECEGRALVDQRYLPIGVLLVHHQADGRHKLHAHFGRFLREYPVACLRSIKEVCDSLRERGIYELHCSADESVAGSEKLVKWLRGEPTGEREHEGPVYSINLRNTPI